MSSRPARKTQHDTSPHEVTLCYSRILFFENLPTFQRFDCKVFLTDAARYLHGVNRGS